MSEIELLKEETLADAIPKEQDRVRGVLETYKGLGGVGAFAATIIEMELKEMESAVISGDPVRMLRAYKALKGCE